jgi:3-oxoacyl-(acyl-carrier-protein) synthase
MIPIVISGIGHCSAAGLGVDPLRRTWLDGARVEATRETVRTERGETTVLVLRAPALTLPPRTVPEAVERRMSRLAKMCFVTAAEALADAAPLQDPQRTGVVVGSAFGSLNLANAYQKRILQDGAAGASPTLFAASIHNSIAAQLTLAFGLRGPNSTVSTMEQTAIGALHLAYDWIQQDIVDRVVLVLGDELSEYHLYYFANLPGARPAGEGMIALILEREDLAAKKYARIEAPHLTSSDARGKIFSCDEGRGTHAAIYGSMLMGGAFEMALAALSVERGGGPVTCVQSCRGLCSQSVRFF